MGKLIPLSVPNLKGNELKYATQAIESEWVSTGGAFIVEFEKKIAEYVGAKGAVACQSGTAGLHLALMLCGVCKDDEVIVPSLTFIAAVNPVKYIGAEPVFMDCDYSLCIDPIKLNDFCEQQCLFTDGKLIDRATGKQIKAIVAVHIFGNMADMEAIIDIADRYSLKVVEDATEALGTFYTDGKFKGRFAGTMGDVGVFSFNGNKIITTGGGGMIVSNNGTILKRAKYLSTQAKDDDIYYLHNEIGYNYRMTNLQAAVGLGQLEQLETFIKTKNGNYDYYEKLGVKLLPFRSGVRSNKWFYSFLTDTRDGLIDYFKENQVQTRPVWQLIHTLPPYQSSRSYRIEKAVYYHRKIVNLPCSTNLAEQDIERVSQLIKKYPQPGENYGD